MIITINSEITKLNIDILAKCGIKKATINKLHKLKAKIIGDLINIDSSQLKILIEQDIAFTQFAEILSLNLIDFTRKVFENLKADSTYELVLLHIANHTHQEIAQTHNLSKEKLKQTISKFLHDLFTLVDALGPMLINDQHYIGIEDLEALFDDEDSYQLLLLAFKAHDTKWVYHTDAECFTQKHS